jgi:hypothetical protein
LEDFMSDYLPGRDHADNGQDGSSTTGMPRWVKVFLIVAVALAVLAVVVMLVVGGEHGPGRHQSMITTLDAAGHLTVAPFTGRDLG